VRSYSPGEERLRWKRRERGTFKQRLGSERVIVRLMDEESGESTDYRDVVEEGRNDARSRAVDCGVRLNEVKGGDAVSQLVGLYSNSIRAMCCAANRTTNSQQMEMEFDCCVCSEKDRAPSALSSYLSAELSCDHTTKTSTLRPRRRHRSVTQTVVGNTQWVAI